MSLPSPRQSQSLFATLQENNWILEFSLGSNYKIIVIFLKQIPNIFSLFKAHMNESAQRTRKNYNCYPTRRINQAEGQGGPKMPPKFSRYQQDVNMAKKKELVCKQKKYKVSEKNPTQVKSSDCEIESKQNKSRIMFNNEENQKINNKKQKKDHIRLKKHQIPKLIKPTHQLKLKNCNKQNKPPSPIFQYQPKSAHMSQMGFTNTIGYEIQRRHHINKKSLACNESLTFNQRLKVNKTRHRNQEIRRISFDIMNQKILGQKPRQKVKSPAEQIAEFYKNHQDSHSKEESEALTALFLKEKNYFYTQNYNCYLEKTQPYITWFKRAIVINWMIEVSENCGCRRQFLAIAVNILDRYLALTQGIQLEDLQKIACAAMSLSNKIDGMVFNIKSLCEQTQNISIRQIQELEVIIAIKLQWKLNPPTSNMWANRIALQWDMYLQHQNDHLSPLLRSNMKTIKFKTENADGYNNYRSLMQYIDLALMDVHSLRYHSRQVAASFIYLILTRKLNGYEFSEIIEKFPLKSDYLLKESQFNEFYCDFLTTSFGFALRDLLPTIQFCATFFILNLCFRLPAVIQQNSEDMDITFEQLCAFQSMNSCNLEALKRRDRQYD